MRLLLALKNREFGNHAVALAGHLSTSLENITHLPIDAPVVILQLAKGAVSQEPEQHMLWFSIWQIGYFLDTISSGSVPKINDARLDLEGRMFSFSDFYRDVMAHVMSSSIRELCNKKGQIYQDKLGVNPGAKQNQHFLLDFEAFTAWLINEKNIMVHRRQLPPAQIRPDLVINDWTGDTRPLQLTAVSLGWWAYGASR